MSSDRKTVADRRERRPIRTAVILAAGRGTRFGDRTADRPKGFIEFKGTPMIVRSVRTLVSCGMERIIIGTGYRREWYEELGRTFPQVECRLNPRYSETGSMYTLWNCRSAIGKEDFLLLESDLVFERRAITALLDSAHDSAMLISDITKFQDQYYVESNEREELVDCSTDGTAVRPSGELVGIHRISGPLYSQLCRHYSTVADGSPELGYEYELVHVSRHVMPMHVVKVSGLKWYEIDDWKDLEYAETHVDI